MRKPRQCGVARVAIALMAATVSIAAATPGGSASGELDPTFSVDGRLTGVAPWAVDPSGRLISFAASSGAAPIFYVRRHQRNGELDTTFSGDGLAPVSFGSASLYLAAAATATHVFVLGVAPARPTYGRLAFARLTVNGALDRSFGDNGLTVLTQFEEPNGAFFPVHVDPTIDGGLAVTVLATSPHGGTMPYAIRLGSDGALASQFNGFGIMALPKVETARFTSTGRLYTLTHSDDFRKGEYWLRRYTKSGGVDVEFSGDGKVLVRGCSRETLPELLIDNNARALVHCRRATSTQALVLRFTKAGALDTTFSDDGTTVAAACCEAAIDSVGRPVLAGTPNFADTQVIRLTRRGSFDRSFSGDGKVLLVELLVLPTVWAVLDRIYLATPRETIAIDAS